MIARFITEQDCLDYCNAVQSELAKNLSYIAEAWDIPKQIENYWYCAYCSVIPHGDLIETLPQTQENYDN